MSENTISILIICGGIDGFKLLESLSPVHQTFIAGFVDIDATIALLVLVQRHRNTGAINGHFALLKHGLKNAGKNSNATLFSGISWRELYRLSYTNDIRN
jgi:hypothetical protein